MSEPCDFRTPRRAGKRRAGGVSAGARTSKVECARVDHATNDFRRSVNLAATSIRRGARVLCPNLSRGDFANHHRDATATNSDSCVQSAVHVSYERPVTKFCRERRVARLRKTLSSRTFLLHDGPRGSNTHTSTRGDARRDPSPRPRSVARVSERARERGAADPRHVRRRAAEAAVERVARPRGGHRQES